MNAACSTSRQRQRGQTGKHAWCQDRAAAPNPTPSPHPPPLPSAGFCPLLLVRDGGTEAANPIPPHLPRWPELVAYLLRFALSWLSPGEEGRNEPARPKGAPPADGSQPAYLLRPRLRRSPQARILFCASMCVRLPAFSPSMLSTQSPTATPACAALPPGVSCGETGHKTADQTEANSSQPAQAAHFQNPEASSFNIFWADAGFQSDLGGVCLTGVSLSPSLFSYSPP